MSSTQQKKHLNHGRQTSDAKSSPAPKSKDQSRSANPRGIRKHGDEIHAVNSRRAPTGNVPPVSGQSAQRGTPKNRDLGTRRTTSSTSRESSAPQQVASAEIKYDQQGQRVNYQYNAQSINIINASSFQDLSSDAKVMLSGFVNAIDSVKAVDPDMIAEQVIAGIKANLSDLVMKLQQSQPETTGLQDLIQRARVGIRQCTTILNTKYQQALNELMYEAANEGLDQNFVAQQLSKAKVFLAAAATLTIIAVDLMTTGGMITLLSLGYGAGITMVTQRTIIGVCSQCGARLQ